MPSVYLPTLNVQTVNLGTSLVSNPPSLILEVNGVIYGEQYTELTTSTYTRTVFPTYESSTNTVKLTCITLGHGEDPPAFNLTNVKVYVVG